MLNGIIYVVNFVTSLGNFYFYPRITIILGINKHIVGLVDVKKQVIGFEVHQSYFIFFIPIQLKSSCKFRLVTAYYNLEDVLCAVFFTICFKRSTSIYN